MSKTNQPAWWAIAHTGDVNVLQEGGGYLLVDRRGAYEPEWNLWDEQRKQLSRISLERCHELPGGGVGDNRFHVLKPAWFGTPEKLVSAASTCGLSSKQLQSMLVCSNPVYLLRGYEMLVAHHGVYEFDQYPVDYKVAEARRLFRKFERQIAVAAAWKDGYA